MATTPPEPVVDPLVNLQESWDAAGRTDPYWAVLTHPGKSGNRWNADEFFASGVAEIQEVMDELTRLGAMPQTRRALDFGCGPGRLSQALATHFEAVDGVDIAPSMIELANKMNQHPDRCHYHVNVADDLAIFPDDTFDFVYSNITLQHVKPQYARAYIREFMRVLQPGGVLVFQLPSRLIRLSARIKARIPGFAKAWYIRARRIEHPAREMNGMPRAQVLAYLTSLGAQFVSSSGNAAAGGNWESFRYVWRRPA